MGAWLHAPSTIRQRWVWPAASFTAVIPNFVGYIDIADLNAVFNNALRADGLDIRCFIEDVAAVLDRDLVETYNQGAQTGQLWVRFDASNAADTVMEIYGGAGDLVANDITTWTSADVVEAYLTEDAASPIVDRVGALNLTQVGVLNYNQVGQIEDATDFTGDGNYAWRNTNIGDTAFTVMGWAYLDTLPGPGDGGGIYCWDANNAIYGMHVLNNYLTCFYYDSGIASRQLITSAANSVQINTWMHLAACSDLSSGAVFRDGVDISTGTIAPASTSASGNTYMGCFPTLATLCIDGRLDTILVFDTKLSDDYIAAEYGNQDDPSAFYTPGAVEYPPAPAGGPLPGESIMGIGLAMGMGV